jgi:sigma-E factor negative regulatory protein RseB
MIVVKCFIFILFIWVKTASGGNSQLHAADARPEGKQVLLKMVQAMKTLNYQGTVVFLKNDKLEPMKYFHAAKNDREQERLLSLNSPLREIIRDSRQVSCLFKTTRQLVIDHRPFERSFLVDIPQNLDELDAVYAIERIGEENVALLPAYVIAIKPKDIYRYARKIWIEKQNYLPLKVVVSDTSGKTVEQLIFTEFELKKSLPFVKVKAADILHLQQEPISDSPDKLSKQPTFVPSSLPPGFREIFFTRRLMHNSSQPVDHMLLSDGFASVSVYMENKRAGLPPDSTAQKNSQSVGAINFFSKTIDNFELTVLGEVPAETVRLIAEGIKLKDIEK